MKKMKMWLTEHPLSKILGALSLNLLFVRFANAQTLPPPPSPVQNSTGLMNVLCSFIAYFFWIVIIISVIFVLYAAFSYVTAGDDTEKTTKARKTLTYAAIGIAVALLATTFPTIVGSIFPNATLSLSPGQVCTVFGG
jgi:heme/copper-type cytochrome/quinol oxidase subunit 2